jgi:protein-S-isoprenylcysteine O-methyltransferase Ste14
MTTLHLRALQRTRRQANAWAAGGVQHQPPKARFAPGLLLGLPALAWALSALLAPAPWRVTALPGLGLTLIAIGLAWAGAAAWGLLRAGNPLAPGAAPRVLVDSGPYAVSRHPMVLGTGVALAGAAIATGSIPAAATALAWVVAHQRWWLPAEEAQLRATFGGWYRDHEARTGRWGP